MQNGAMISKGPSNWQILQQTGGFACIRLEGTWVPVEERGRTGKVFVRVLLENNGYPVIPWRECATESGGTWSVELAAVPAGGLYRIETCFCEEGNAAIEWSLRGDMIHHIGVGDLYVIAGQSNSAGYGKDPANDPPELGVHVLRNSGLWDLATHPLNESTGTLHEVNREGANPGSSPYLTFGKLLKKELGYPIGLVQASLGGSPLKDWNPEENGCLYRNMLEIVQSTGGRLKGVLWYQGCSDANAEAADTYLERFASMVRHMREDLGDGELSVLTVQLNRCVAPADEMANICWGKVREAQRQAPKRMSGVYVVPATDLPLSDEIHNSSAANIVLGERLAKTALASIYGCGPACLAPEIAKAERCGDRKVKLTFDHVTGRILVFGTAPEKLPFTVEDEQGRIGLEGWEQEGANAGFVKLSRELKGRAYVHGVYEQNPCTVTPVDVNGYLPMLSFYGVEIL